MAPPLVAEASSQLLNYIFGSQVSEQSKFSSFRHYRPHATVMAKVAHNTGKIKCISASASIHLELNNFTQANYHNSLVFGMQWNEALCAARLLWLIHTHTWSAAALLHLFYCWERRVGNKTALVRWSRTSGVYCVPLKLFTHWNICGKFPCTLIMIHGTQPHQRKN